MSKQCPRCGSVVEDNERFCPECGVNVGLSNDSQQPVSVEQPAGSSPVNTYKEREMSLGSWVGTIIVTTFFGIISIVFLFVWAFDVTQPKAKQNYCKAMLIVEAIIIGLSIILMIIAFAFLASLISSASSGDFQSFFEEFEYAFDEAIQNVA